ncbi:hypothetical protein [Chelativorans xinjiangense]|uniref:hypothetical protein n=1 Tax=Chelativorans xinjiangense TaxID=2681485 RepID=UPI0013588163|nr:hypothetical protein [Chelativorans xinjiangense]
MIQALTYTPETTYIPQAAEDPHVETSLSADDSLSDDALSRLDPDHDNLLSAQSGAAGDEADADAFEAAYEADAELGGTLREAFLSYGREEMGDAQVSLNEVLSHMGTFPGPEDDALSRRLAKAAGLYGGEEGETDVSPAQTEYLRAQLLLALTDEVDWATELGTQAADGQEVTSDGMVLHGAGAMTVAQAANAASDRIGGALMEELNWATPPAAAMADALMPVLIGDPTLSLPEPPETILYGSLEWAQLWIGMEYAEGAGLDPAQLSVDELVALGRAATSVNPAADRADTQSAAEGPAANDGAEKRDEASTAASYRATKLLILIARARGVIDGASITEENQADLEKTLADVAHDVFKEEFAIAEALEVIGRDALSSRKEIAREILRDNGLNPDQEVDYILGGDMIAGGPVTKRTTLAEVYFQHGNLNNILDFTPPSDLPDPATVFDETFEEKKDSFSEAMATFIGQSVALYAKQHNLNLEDATITISRPVLEVPYWVLTGFSWGLLILPLSSNNSFFIDIAFPNSNDPEHFVLRLEEAGKGLQKIESAQEWAKANANAVFGANTLEKANGKLAPGCELSYAAKEVASGTMEEAKSAFLGFYTQEVEKSRDQLRGETTGEAVGNFFLDLIPFRAMVVAIQKGDVAGAITNGFFDVLSFIPFVGEGLQAVKAGGRMVSAGISAFVRSTLEDGLSMGLSAGLHAADTFGHAFGKQLFKTAVTGLESAMPIPTPSLASHITVAGVKDATRVAEHLRATLPALADTVEDAASRSRLIDIGADGEQTLASSARVTKDAERVETIEVIPHGAGEASVDLDKVELALGRNDENEIVFLKEHYDEAGERFYTLADPRTGGSYGARLTAEEADKLISREGGDISAQRTGDNLSGISTEDPARLDAWGAANYSYPGRPENIEPINDQHFYASLDGKTKYITMTDADGVERWYAIEKPNGMDEWHLRIPGEPSVRQTTPVAHFEDGRWQVGPEDSLPGSGLPGGEANSVPIELEHLGEDPGALHQGAALNGGMPRGQYRMQSWDHQPGRPYIIGDTITFNEHGVQWDIPAHGASLYHGANSDSLLAFTEHVPEAVRGDLLSGHESATWNAVRMEPLTPKTHAERLIEARKVQYLQEALIDSIVATRNHLGWSPPRAQLDRIENALSQLQLVENQPAVQRQYLEELADQQLIRREDFDQATETLTKRREMLRTQLDVWGNLSENEQRLVDQRFPVIYGIDADGLPLEEPIDYRLTEAQDYVQADKIKVIYVPQQHVDTVQALVQSSVGTNHIAVEAIEPIRFQP